MSVAVQQLPTLQPIQDTGSVDRSSGLMTPARRAALDALEREFRELLDIGHLKGVAR